MSSDGEIVKTFGGGGNDLSKAVRSQQDIPNNYGGLEYYNPPFDPWQLAKLLDVHTAHDVAVRKKAQYVAGFGLDVVPVDPQDDAPDPPDALVEFWERGNHQLGPDNQPATVNEVLTNAWEDYEAIGWTAVEILTRGDGTPSGLAHVPAHTIRRVKSTPAYVQLDGGKTVGYFGIAGNRYGDDPVFIDHQTGETGATGDAIANELIVIRNYAHRHPYYGSPDIISAIETVEADVEARRYNSRFFENDGVPRFAVIVEGGKLTDRAWNKLEAQFKDLRAAENSHRGVLLEAGNLAEQYSQDHNVEIRIEPLTVGVDEDASFTEFRKANRHDILRAHEVPPVIAGDMPDANRSITEELRQVFAEEVIAPKQAVLAARLYKLLHATAFAATAVPDADEWTVELKLKGADARMQEAEIADERMQAAGKTLTVNEARSEIGYDELDGPQGNMLVSELTGDSGGMGGGSPGAVERARAYDTRKYLRKAEYSENDPIELDGERGLVLEVYTEDFEWDGTEYEASADTPAYVVATESSGAQVVRGSDLSSSDWDEDVEADPDAVTDAEAKADTAKDIGFDSWPDSWEAADTPARLIAIRAWLAMGASFRGCMTEIKDAEICASFKDEIYQTTAWRR